MAKFRPTLGELDPFRALETQFQNRKAGSRGSVGGLITYQNGLVHGVVIHELKKQLRRRRLRCPSLPLAKVNFTRLQSWTPFLGTIPATVSENLDYGIQPS